MHRKDKNRLAAVLLTLSLAGFAYAQENAPAPADDPFGADFEAALFGDGGEADEDLPASGDLAATDENRAVQPLIPGASETVRTEYLIGGSAVARVDSAVQTASGESLVSSSATGRVFAKVSVPDYGALYLAYNLSHYFLQASSEADQLVPPGSEYDPYAPEFSLSEFHYSFDIDKKLFVRLGNQLIAWGPARVWTPVDFINLEKADAFAALDSRTGKPGLRLHVPLPGANVFAFGDFSGLQPDDGTYNDLLEATNLGGRFDFTARAFEFGLTAYGGQNAQARYGVDFSGRLLGTSLYAEAASGPAYDDYDFYLQSVLGFSRSLGELKRWTLSAEGFYNTREDESAPLYQGNWYAYASLANSELFSTYLTGTLSVLANLEDQSYTVKLAHTLSLPRAVPFTFEAAYAGGGENKEFTSYAGDRSVSLSLFTTLSF